MRFTEIVDHLLVRAEPADPTLWHKWATVFPIRLVDGRWSMGGDCWRRETSAGFEYRQDPETPEEFWDSQI